ncbi:hypothetical protein IW261DRAFT_1568933 [Armillaria novae-zelandiae]|uniref:Uncharacterized protein n=1 Tax=Armillaria novae-zelandiae TaxID=153914 RepID=A0AA39NYI8_9AGAR|nr:hypothetical protein IW261DRAFT_1568933 [Armillaria novae-zelandiae]
MSTSDHYGRSGVQRPVRDTASRAYRGYGAVEAGALGQSQAADNRASCVRKTIEFIVGLPFALIALAIFDGIISAIISALIVTGHWILLHLDPTSSSYSQVSLWSTFLAGFWGSAITSMPFCILCIALNHDSDCTRTEDCVPAFLNLALVIAKIALECIVGVPLVRHFGVTTLQLGDAICAAYIGVIALLLGMVVIMALLVLTVWLFVVFQKLVSEAFHDPASEHRRELSRAVYTEIQRTDL